MQAETSLLNELLTLPPHPVAVHFMSNQYHVAVIVLGHSVFRPSLSILSRRPVVDFWKLSRNHGSFSV